MDLKINTKRKPLTVAFDFKSNKPVGVNILTVNPTKPNTVYANATITVSGDGKYFLRLPASPDNILVRITSSIPNSLNYNYSILPLKQNLSAFDYLNPDTLNFIKFLQEFAENAGVLSSGNRSIYYSDNGKFRIDYVDVIKDKDGKSLTTPAAAGKITKKISFASNVITKFSVTAIMAFGLHEYAHAYINIDIDDEQEADLNALKILLGLGYSRKEILHAFMQIFSISQQRNGVSKINQARADAIVAFIKKFENMNTPNYSYYYEGEKQL